MKHIYVHIFNLIFVFHIKVYMIRRMFRRIKIIYKIYNESNIRN